MLAHITVLLFAMSKPCCQANEQQYGQTTCRITTQPRRALTNPGEYIELSQSICMDGIVVGRALRVRCIYGMCLREASIKGVSLGHTSIGIRLNRAHLVRQLLA